MTDVQDAADSLLADRPDLEDDLRTVIDIDTEHETWTYDDVPLDSGAFGELVSRGIVEKVGEEYRLADREAIQVSLKEEEAGSLNSSSLDFSVELPPRWVSCALVSTLALVVTFRLFAYQSVFRAEHVVLLGNDPYYYRHWLFNFVEQGTGVFSLPDAVTVGEPLMLATLLAATKLLGGTARAANLVLAWYPVAAALVTGALVYSLTVKLTEDRRVGLAAVALLAVTPVHAYRTAIGFADHHAFDYLWLAVTAVAAVTLLKRTSTAEFSSIQSPRTLMWAAVLGLGVAAQVLAWNAGPILLLPLALYGVLQTAVSVGSGESPLDILPLAVGIGIGAILVFGAHVVLGWQRLDIVVTPFLLATGLGVVIIVGELARRRGLSGSATLGILVVSGGVTFSVAYVTLPEFAAQFTHEVVRLFVGGTNENIAETASLFSPRYGTIVGPFFFFGLSLFFALPYLIWSLYVGWSSNRPAWLLIGSYSGLLFVLALLQVRFAGELALFIAVFGGLAIVHLAAVTGATARPTILSETETVHPWRADKNAEPSFSLPNRQTVIAVGFVFLLVGGLGALMTPLRTNLLTHDTSTIEAATSMNHYAEKHNQTWPENYVLSEWSNNRIYNAFVSGNSAGYQYAQENYENFLTATNGSAWYHRLGDRSGFVVTRPYPALENTSDETLYATLQHRWGNGTAHYRPIYGKDGGRKAFAVVKGAIVTGRVSSNEIVELKTKIDVGETTVPYTRTTTATANGWYAVRVTAPVKGPGVHLTEPVTMSNVTSGRFGAPRGRNGYWPMNASRGDVAFDISGGHHGVIRGAQWTETGLRFSGTDGVVIQHSPDVTEGFRLGIWLKPTGKNGTVRLAGTAPLTSFGSTQGVALTLNHQTGRVTGLVGNGSATGRVDGNLPQDDNWHHVVFAWNGTTMTLTIDQQLIKASSYRGSVSEENRPFILGSGPNRENGYVGKIRNMTLIVAEEK